MNKDFTMNKVLFVLLSLYALPTADLLAAEVTEATPKKRSLPDLPGDLLGKSLTFLDNDAVQKITQTSKQNEGVAMRHAASIYAKALKAGDHVPDDTMKVLLRAHDRDTHQADVIHSIMAEIMDADRYNIIHLPNAIPAFLRTVVTDKTSAVYDMIDQMSLNPHIKEHMKHSVGHYYESEKDKWAIGCIPFIQNALDAMAQQYRLLGAIEEDATLDGVQFIVIPAVGNTDVAITDRTKDLDTLFRKHPHLTLVVSFNDDVTRVGDDFCYDPLGRTSTLPASIKKFSFTGKKLTTVGKDFFSEARSLTSVDFRGLRALTTVGYYFFYDAKALTSVDLSGLRALTTVGGRFFSGASALPSVDFRGLSALTTVGRGFFSYARSLTSVNFGGLGALQTVGDDFFFGASALPSVDFRGLVALQTVGDCFFYDPVALTSVNFGGLGALQTVGDNFFSHPRSLTSVDFRELSALQTVGSKFFNRASALTRIICHNEDQAQLIRDKYVGEARISVVCAGHGAKLGSESLLRAESQAVR